MFRFIGLAAPSRPDPRDAPHWKHKVLPVIAKLAFPRALTELRHDRRRHRLRPGLHHRPHHEPHQQARDRPPPLWFLGHDKVGSAMSRYAVSSPAVVLAAIAQATTKIRLTSAVSVLSTLDPVRLHQDFATLDLLSLDHRRAQRLHRTVRAFRSRSW